MRHTQCGEVFAPDPAECRVVPQQVGQFRALLDQMGARKPGDLLVEVVDAEHLAEDHARIVEAQRLVKVAGH